MFFLPVFVCTLSVGMIIKPGHQNIDVEGGIFMSYLSEWNQNSNLVELVALLASLFSMDPPLYSKPPGYQPPTTSTTISRATYPPNPPSNSFGSTNASNNNSSNSNNTNAGYTTQTSYQPPVITQYGRDPQQNPQSMNPIQQQYGVQTSTTHSYQPQTLATTVSKAADQMTDAVRRGSGTGFSNSNPSVSGGNAQSSNPVGRVTSVQLPGSNAGGGVAAGAGGVNVSATTTVSAAATNMGSASTTASVRYRPQLEAELNMKLKRDLRDYYLKLKQEVDAELASQWSLQNSADSMNDILTVYADAKEKLSAGIEEMEQKSTDLEAWLKEKDDRGEVDVENYLQPYDELSTQIIRLQSEVLAVDDAIYYLEKALANSVIDLPTFLKETRNLARIQFMAKIHLMKIDAFVTHAAHGASTSGR